MFGSDDWHLHPISEKGNKLCWSHAVSELNFTERKRLIIQSNLRTEIQTNSVKLHNFPLSVNKMKTYRQNNSREHFHNMNHRSYTLLSFHPYRIHSICYYNK
jgi:hypothetical protein